MTGIDFKSLIMLVEKQFQNEILIGSDRRDKIGLKHATNIKKKLFLYSFVAAIFPLYSILVTTFETQKYCHETKFKDSVVKKRV